MKSINLADKNYEIPKQYQRALSEIMSDNETIIAMGEGRYAVKRLRWYTLEKIYQVMLDSLPEGSEGMSVQEYDLKLILGDMRRIATVVALCLCNQYFDEDRTNYSTPFERDRIMGENEFLIMKMTDKVMFESNESLQDFVSIVSEAFNNLDVAGLFTFASSVKVRMGLTMRLAGKIQNQETLQHIQSAGLGQWGTSSKQTPR